MHTDNANSIRINSYRTLDLQASYRFVKSTLTLRARNVTGERYATWVGSTTNEVMLGALRSVDLTWRATF